MIIGKFLAVSAFGLGFVGSLGFVGLVFAADVSPDAVVINDDLEVSASLTGAAGDAKAGREWYSGRKLGNCLACHATTELNELAFHGEVGPSMDGVAERYNVAQLRGILTNSKAIFGDQTIMPGFYSNKVGVRVNKKFKGTTILTAQQVEDVLAYLQTLK
jgi:sulfur-oxidizing protein SoxX